DITLLLRRWRDGSKDAENELFRLVMPDLCRLAHYFVSGERTGHTVRSGDLVNQTYLKLVKAKDRDWQNRRQFIAIAARSMRRYLIDYFRSRPEAEFVPLDGVQAVIRLPVADRDQVLAIDLLLAELEREHPELCAIVELKMFLNLTTEEAARTLG